MNNRRIKKLISKTTFRRLLPLVAILLFNFSASAQGWYATAPYSTSFEDATDNGAWILLNGSSTDSTSFNIWTLGQATNNTTGGSSSLYISDSIGGDYFYNDTITSTAIAYRNLTLDAGLYSIAFDWFANGEADYDYLLAALVPESDTTVLAGGLYLPDGVSRWGLPDGWINLGGQSPSIALSTSPQWNRQNSYANVPISGNYKLIFIWTNDASDGSNPPAAIDNIALRQIFCLAPTSLTATQGVHSITLQWTSNGNEDEWIVSSDDTTFTTNTTSCTFTDLQPYTQYSFSVRSVCDDGDTSLPATINATTGFEVPFVENFDALYSFPAGWSYTLTGDSAYSTDYYAPQITSFGDGNALRLRGFGYVTLPVTDARIDTLQMTFTHEVAAASRPLAVGIMNGSTFVPVDTIDDPAGTYRHTIYFLNYNAGGNNIAFRNFCDDTEVDYATHYIDNISVEYLPSCFPVQNVTAVADSTSATVSWTPLFGGNEWIAEIYRVGDSVATAQSICTTTTATFSNLLPNTDYIASVRRICGENDTSEARTVSFNTLCAAVTVQELPYVYGFEDGDGVGRCWSAYANTVYNTPSSSWGNAHSGISSYNLSSSDSNWSYVVLPLFATNPNTLMVSLYARANRNGNQLVFGVMDDPEDYTTFTAVDTMVFSNTYDLYEIPLTNYSGTGRFIALLCDSGSNQSIYIDDVTVELTPACSRIRDLEVPAVTAGAAFMRWNNGRVGNYIGAQIQYRDTLSDSWETYNTNSHDYLATGLYYNTTYELRIAARCEGDELSNVVTTLFTTKLTGCNGIDSTSLWNDTISGFSASNHFEVPVHNWHPYSFSEQLYTAAELDTIGSISAISFFYVADTLPMTAKDSCFIYMGLTDRTSISYSDFIHPNDLTLVYSGPLNCTAGWNTFAFNEGFINYDGRSSLVVAVVDYSGDNHDEAYRFRCHDASGKTVSMYSDEYTFENYMLMEQYNYPYRNDAIFQFSECAFESECFPPMVSINQIEATSASFTLIPGANEEQWSIYVRAIGDSAFTLFSETTLYNFTINNLLPSTSYTIRIVGDCDDQPYSDVIFTTKCLPQTVPYTEDFAGWPVGASPIVPSCWTKFNPLGPNMPYIYPWNVQGRSSVLYLFSNASSYSLVALPEFEPAIDSLQISFYMLREYNSSSNNNYEHQLQLGIMTDVDDIESFFPLDTIILDEVNSWQFLELPLNSLAEDSTLTADQFEALRHGRITLLSPDSVYSYPYIDDIKVDYIPRCKRPTGLAKNTSLSTADSLVLTWDNNNEEGLGWMLYINDTSYLATTNTIAIGGLNPGMVYNVSLRKICGEYTDDNTLIWSDTSEAVEIQVRTSCGIIKYSPWVEGFELLSPGNAFSSSFAPCWLRINEASNYYGIPYVSDDNGYYSDCHSGERGLNWSADISPLAANEIIIATPVIDTAALPINTLQMSFWARSASGTQNPMFKIGVINDGDTSGSSFVGVDTITINGITSWRKYTVYFSEYDADGNRIAIKTDRPDDDWEASIDDIEIKLMPLCPPVTGITATGIDTNSITLTWTDHGNANSWDVEYGPHGFEQGQGTFVYATSSTFTITGLATSTKYDFFVRPVCDETGDWAMATFTTADPYFELPFLCSFNDEAQNGKWNFSSGSHQNAWYIGSALGNDDNSSLYISQDGGTTNTYNRDVTGISYAFVNLALPDTGNYNYRFDWRSNGQAGYDFLRVALAPISFAPEGGTYAPNGFTATSLPLEWIALDGGSQLAGDTSQWTTIESEAHITSPGIYRLIFCWYNHAIAFGHDNPAAIDNVIFRHTSCQTPSNLNCIAYDDSIYVSWTSNGDETAWIVSCQDTSIVAYNTNCMLTGLTANTQYTVSVRAFCFVGDTSMAVSTPVHTTCNPIVLPYSDNFDSYTTLQGSNGFTDYLPECWLYQTLGNDGTRNPQLYYGSGSANSGNYSMFMGREAYLALPPTPLPLNRVQVTFYHKVNNSDFGIQIGVLEGNTFVPIESISDPEGQYVSHTVSFQNYTGSSRIIAFHNTNPMDGIGAPNFIDDLLIEELPDCMPVTGITSPSQSTTSLNIDWTDVTTALDWEIEYGPAGFTQGEGTTITATSHPVNITSLDTLSTYDFYVRAHCSDTGYSDWSAPVQFSTTFCEDALSFSTGSGNGTSYYIPVSTFYEYSLTEFIIDSAELAGIGNISAIAFFYNHTDSLNVKNDVTIWFQPTTRTSFANVNSILSLDTNIATRVYSGRLDATKGWNYYNLENEYVWDGVRGICVFMIDNSGASTTSSFTFRTASCSGKKTVSYCSGTSAINPFNPTSGFSGNRNNYNYRPAMQLISCGAANCPEPVYLTASNISFDTAVISWRGMSTTYEVAVKEASETDWPEAVTVTTTGNLGNYHLTGLEEQTTYAFRVRQLCVTGVMSEWAEATFTTAIRPCMAPTGLDTVSVGYDQVVIDWTPNNPQSQYYIRLSHGNNEETFVVTSHPYTLTGLTDNFTYSVAVADSCLTSGTVSDFTPAISFTTRYCQPVTNVEVSNITATSAHVTWTGNGNSYTIEYGEGNFSEGTGTTVSNITGNSYTINGLQKDTEYSVYVRKNCTATAHSLWSQRKVFTTTNEGIMTLDSQHTTLSLYPNPANGHTTLTLSGIEGTCQVNIVDLNGRTLYSTKLDGCYEQCTTRIDLGTIPSGTYFVQVAGKNANIVRKLIVK